MLRIDPLRTHAEIILQRGENSLDLVGPERAANGQILQRRIREFDLDA